MNRVGSVYTEAYDTLEVDEAHTGESKSFLEKSKELASSLESLPTGMRIRSIAGTVSGAFIHFYLSIAISNAGLSAKINTGKTMRQTTADQSGLLLFQHTCLAR